MISCTIASRCRPSGTLHPSESSMTMRHHLAVLTLSLVSVLLVSAQSPADYQRQGREILKELIETDTTHSAGSTTVAAERMAARLVAAGFPKSRCRGRGQQRESRTSARQSRCPLPRAGFTPARPLHRAPRRRRSQARGLVDGAVRPEREGRLFLRPRDARCEGRRSHTCGGVRALARRRVGAGSRPHPGAHRRRRRRGPQRHRVADRQPARTDFRRRTRSTSTPAAASCAAAR